MLVRPRFIGVAAMALLLLSRQPGNARTITGATYRHMAEAAVQAGDYARAAEYYRLEAQVYRSHGDVNGAIFEESKAERYTTELQLFVSAPPDRKALNYFYSGAKWEPLYGCYLGAYVAGDSRLDIANPDSGNVRYAERAGALGDLLHKHLATSWDYCSYGAPFPGRWARALMDRGITPHIAWEPNNGLDRVQNDEYLRRFAEDAAACGGPIFLRFAGEMNGDWTPWHQSAEQYKEKFRLVHDVMAQVAPNVAMIWCVGQVPEYNMEDYYPGDAYVDWVGVNFYSVLHHDNDPSRPAAFENPASLLKHVYHLFAARKPIAICEYGASHQERLNPAVDYSDVAATKFAQLLASLPREFPRVRLVGFFDNNNLSGENVMPGRALNNYCLTDSPPVLTTLHRMLASEYFLPGVVGSAQLDLPHSIRPLAEGSACSGAVHFSAWVKTYVERPNVTYTLDGHPLAQIHEPGDYGLDLDTRQFAVGTHRLQAQVWDDRSKLAAVQTVTLRFLPVIAPPPPATAPVKPLTELAQQPAPTAAPPNPDTVSAAPLLQDTPGLGP